MVLWPGAFVLAVSVAFAIPFGGGPVRDQLDLATFCAIIATFATMLIAIERRTHPMERPFILLGLLIAGTFADLGAALLTSLILDLL